MEKNNCVDNDWVNLLPPFVLFKFNLKIFQRNLSIFMNSFKMRQRIAFSRLLY